MTNVLLTDKTVGNDAAYLAARRDSPQKIPYGTWSRQTIIMNVKQGNGIQYDTETGMFILEKDKTYRITAQLGWKATTPEYYQFALFRSRILREDTVFAEAISPKVSTCDASNGLLDVILTPENTEEYELRMSEHTTAGDSSFIREDVSTFLNIAEVPASFEWLSARRTTKQTIPAGKSTWGGRNVLMNQVAKGSTIKYNYGFFTLTGRKMYRVTAQLGWEATTPEYYQFGIFDADTDEQIGYTPAESLPPNRNTCNASGGVLDIIVYPSTTTGYCLRVTENVSAPPTSVIRDDASTFLNIVEVSENVSIGFGLRYDQKIRKGTWGGQVVKFEQIRMGGIPRTDASNGGKFTLTGRKMYRVTAQLGWEATTPEFYAFGLFSANTGKQIGPLAEALPPNANTCNASGGLLDVIYTPDKDEDVYIKISKNVTAGGSSFIRSDVSTFITISAVFDES
jgi:hypothetical protein